MNAKSEKLGLNYLINLEVYKSLKIAIPALIFITGLRIYSIIDNILNIKNTLKLDSKMISLIDIYGGMYRIFRIVLVLSIAFIGIYSIYIWISEWFGNNKTIYNLLTLPISRTTIILSKVCTCLVLFIVFLSTQYLTVFIEKTIFNIIIPSVARVNESIIDIISNSFTLGNIPTNAIDFLLILLGVTAGISIIFSAVLLERSFGIKGLILGAVLVGLLPVLYIILPRMIIFYKSEELIYKFVVEIIFIVGGFFISKYLLENKVHV